MTRLLLATPLVLATLWVAAASSDTAEPLAPSSSDLTAAEEPPPVHDTAAQSLARRDDLDLQAVHTLYADPVEELQRRAVEDRAQDTANTYTLRTERLSPGAETR